MRIKFWKPRESAPASEGAGERREIVSRAEDARRQEDIEHLLRGPGTNPFQFVRDHTHRHDVRGPSAVAVARARRL